MAEGNVVDAASVKISPDTSNFRKRLRAELRKIDEEVNVDADINVDIDRASKLLRAWREREERKPPIEQKIDIDTAPLTRTLSGLSKLSLGAAAAVAMSDALAGVLSAAISAVGVVNLLPGILATATVAAGTLAIGAEGIGRAFERARGPAEDLQEAVEDAFERSMAPAAESVAGLLPRLHSGFTGVADAIGDSASGFADMLSEARNVDRIRVLLGETEGITRSLGDSLAPIGEALLHISAIGAQMFSDMVDGASDSAQAFRDWVTSAEGTQQIQEWIRGGVDALREIWQLGVDVVGIFRAIGDAFESAGLSLGSAFGSTLTEIREALSSVEGQEILTDIIENIIGISDTVKDVLGTAFTAIGPAVQSALPGIRELVRQIGVLLKGALETVGPLLQSVFGFLSDNMAWIGPLAVGLTGAIVAVKGFTAAVGALKVAFIALSAANPFTAIIAAVITVATFVVVHWDQLKEYLRAAWEWISQTAAAIWNGIVSFFTNLLNGIKAQFTAAWNSVSSTVSSVWNAISNTTQSVWNSVTGFISSVLNSILSFFRNAWNNMKNTVVNAWNSIKNGISSGISNALSLIRQLPGKILKALGNLGSLLVEGGKDLIRGLWRGFQSMIGWVADKIKGAVGGLVNGVKGLLGIASPSRVFADIGRDTMRGFADGIDQQGSDAVRTAQNVVNEIVHVGKGADLDPRPFQWSGLTEGLDGALENARATVASAMADIASIVNSTRLSPEIELGGAAPKFGMVGVSRIEGYSAGGSIAVQPRTTTTQVDGIDYERMAAAVTDALDGVRVEMDPNGILRIVEKARIRKERRR